MYQLLLRNSFIWSNVIYCEGLEKYLLLCMCAQLCFYVILRIWAWSLALKSQIVWGNSLADESLWVCVKYVGRTWMHFMQQWPWRITLMSDNCLFSVSGYIKNTEKLSYGKEHQYKLTVTAYDCGKKRAAEDVLVKISIKPTCKPGWQG